MTQHESKQAGLSQCDKILKRLKQSPNQWVPMLDLHRASDSMAVHSRINDLRNDGHNIEQKSEREGRKVLSFYRLVVKQEAQQGSMFNRGCVV